MHTQPAVTVSLVPQARGGPFVFWDDLPGSCRQAKQLGFAGIEVFAASAEAIDVDGLREMLSQHELRLAALGTGAGWLLHRLSLTDPNPRGRAQAIDFVKRLIDTAGQLGASAIVGSMQGRADAADQLPEVRGRLAEAIAALAEHAQSYDVPLLYEPLNRYETNVCTTLADATALIESAGAANARLLADLFHMNIEEKDVAEAIRQAGRHIGHVHFVDSNRRPAGLGHLRFRDIAAALEAISFDGWLSAEALPFPDAPSAAEQTIRTYRQFFERSE